MTGWLVFAGLCLASAGIIPWAILSRNAALRDGTRWEGWLYWKSDAAQSNHVIYIFNIKVNGDQFSGISGGVEGDKMFEYEIEGSFRGGHIQWKHTRRIADEVGGNTTGAMAEGEIAGEVIDGNYLDRDGDEARFHLTKVR